MAPALFDFQPQPAPKATAAAQAAIGDGLVAEAQAFAGELAAWRHDLHQMPELGNNLPQTSAFIQARLDEMDIPYAVLLTAPVSLALSVPARQLLLGVTVRARTSRPVRSSCSAATWMPFPLPRNPASPLHPPTAACMLAATICMRRPCLVRRACSRRERACGGQRYRQVAVPAGRGDL